MVLYAHGYEGAGFRHSGSSSYHIHKVVKSINDLFRFLQQLQHEELQFLMVASIASITVVWIFVTT